MSQPGRRPGAGAAFSGDRFFLSGALTVVVDHVTRRWIGDEHREDRGEVTIPAA